MQELNTNLDKDYYADQIDLSEVFYALLDGKWIIISLTTLASIIGIIFSLSLPNIYESKTLLVPVNPSSNVSGAIGGFGSFTSLAGLNLPNRIDEGNNIKAIQKISSLSFFENNILPNIYLPDLMAFESWNPELNTVAYDENIYDISTNTWVREYKYPMQQIPSAQESFKDFKTEHLTLTEDKKTGFSTLSIKHQSPYIAKQWAELIVNEINTFYREKDKLESEKAASYLNQQISMTGLSEIKQVLAQLLQEETKKLTLIEANKFYVFDYIDPPAVMEQKSEPKRSVICIISAIFGGILSILIVLIRHYFFINKTS